MTDLTKLTDKDKNDIVLQAIITCRWIGWMRRQTTSHGTHEVQKLKDLIESRLGLEIEELT